MTTPDTTSEISTTEISTSTLIDILRILDAAAEGIGRHPDWPGWYNHFVQMIGPDLTGELDGRVRATSNTRIAHLDEPEAFLTEARQLANELSINVREALGAAGVEVDEYL